MTTRTLRDLLEFAAPSKVETLESGAVVLRGVKLLGTRSANVNPDGSHNVYPLEARQRAVPLYEGAKVFLNHPSRNDPGRERGYEEQLGRIRGAVARADGTFGDLHLNPKHPLAESIAWDAQHAPDSLGLSHNAQGRGRIQGGDCLIEEITRVRSVDLVCAAATTRGLFEGRTEDDVQITKERLAELREAAVTKAKLAGRPKALLEEIDEEALLAILADGAMSAEEKVMQALSMLAAQAITGESGAPTAADEKPGEPGGPPAMEESVKDQPAKGGEAALVESLRKELDELKVREALREKREKRAKLLAESRLPKESVTEVFLEQVHAAETDEAAKALIEDRKRLVFHQVPTSGGRPAAAAGGTQIKSVDDFVGALR